MPQWLLKPLYNYQNHATERDHATVYRCYCFDSLAVIFVITSSLSPVLFCLMQLNSLHYTGGELGENAGRFRMESGEIGMQPSVPQVGVLHWGYWKTTKRSDKMGLLLLIYS